MCSWTTNGSEKKSRVIKKYFETNENENALHQNLWDVANAIWGEKYIMMNASINKNVLIK